MEIVDCVIAVSMKIYSTVEEVQANKKRCQRLAERIRCLVTPLNELIAQDKPWELLTKSHIFSFGDSVCRPSNKQALYKEALIDLVQTLEESRRFLKTFTKEKSMFRKLQDACYTNRVKETFEDLNERLNSLVPALTFGLQVERRRSVKNTFCLSTRLPEDIKDESRDLKHLQEIVNLLGMPSYHAIQSSEVKKLKLCGNSGIYHFYTAEYRMLPVFVKKTKFELTSERKQLFLNDARRILLFNSENVVRLFGICTNPDHTYAIVQELMEFGSLHQTLQTQASIPENILLRMCVESSRGLYFVHCSDVIHHNLSSSKYLVNCDWHVKISGFEFSKTESSLSLPPEQRFCCGSPESQSERSDGSMKSDVYQYGFILCEILSHTSSNRHHSDLEQKLCREACTVALRHLPDTMNPVVPIAEQCLDSATANRPSMREVVARLSLIHNGGESK